MDFSRIENTEGTHNFLLEERTIEQAEVKLIVNQYVKQNDATGSPLLTVIKIDPLSDNKIDPPSCLIFVLIDSFLLLT